MVPFRKMVHLAWLVLSRNLIRSENVVLYRTEARYVYMVLSSAEARLHRMVAHTLVGVVLSHEMARFDIMARSYWVGWRCRR